VVAHHLEQAARESGVDPNRWRVAVVRLLAEWSGRLSWCPVRADALTAAVGALGYPLLGSVYERGHGALDEVPRWAAPVLREGDVVAAARVMDRGATRRVARAVAGSLVSGPVPGPPALMPLAYGFIGAGLVSADEVANVIEAAAEAGAVAAGARAVPAREHIDMARQALEVWPQARRAALLGDAAREVDPIGFAAVMRDLYDCRHRAPRPLPVRWREVVELHRAMVPAVFEPARAGRGAGRSRAAAAGAAGAAGAAAAAGNGAGGRRGVGRAADVAAGDRPAIDRLTGAGAAATADAGAAATAGAGAAATAGAGAAATAGAGVTPPPAPAAPAAAAATAPVRATTRGQARQIQVARMAPAMVDRGPVPDSSVWSVPPPLVPACGFRWGPVELVVPTSAAQLRSWGQVLHNCLGDYSPAVMAGRSWLIGVRCDEVLVGCAEVDPARRAIRQLLGPRNRPLPDRVRDDVVEALQFLGLHSW
jgi:hypothetical protein